MKLIIQIPCLNEAQTLPATLAALPRQVPGFDTVEWLIIDDGSTDRTVEVARAHGVDHVLSLSHNQGLAKAFPAGIRECARLGADVVVNTDADNQYDASFIPALTEPVVNNTADLVIGARPINSIQHFSPIKKILQNLGSAAVRWASSTNVQDAPSGFRAMRIQAALQLNVYNDYTYTIETIIQAGHRGFRIINVPVKVNGDLRPSRLVKSIPMYVRRNMLTILRFFVVYKPLRFFVFASLLPFFVSVGLFSRFILFYIFDSGAGKIQSLLVASVMFLFSILLVAIGLLSDIIAINRRLLEDLRYEAQLRKLEKDREP
ncbi:MAG: glycosyl transferase [Geminicoccus sp.]|nr:glycosyl transferase [Geminicoccus sp.]